QIGLEPIVREAFELIGFDVERDRDKPGWIADGSLRMFYEVDGAEGAVPEQIFHRLQRRLEKDILETREGKRGLLVVNGYRLQDPAARPAQYNDTLRAVAENYRWGLLTTDLLFRIVKVMLENLDDRTLRSTVRFKLLNTTGVVSDDLLPAPPEPEPA